MATTVASLITQVRDQLREATPRYWSDAELTRIIKRGVSDLWGAYLDIHGEHYFAVDDTHVVLNASTETISGIPADCFRVQLLEPRDRTISGVAPSLIFLPRKYNHPDMVAARGLMPQGFGNTPVVYYAISGVGAPVGTMTIRVAPQMSTDLPLRLVYNPTISVDEYNPIPGESDNALIAWTIAYARAKETETQTPDAGWLSIYATEKQSLLTRSTPRQEQEPEYVDGMFDGMWS